MSISAEQKQALAALYIQYKSGTGLIAGNTNYFLTAVKRAGVDQSDRVILNAADKSFSGAQFASAVSSTEHYAATVVVRDAADAAATRLIAKSQDTEALAAAKAVFDAIQ